MARPTSTKIIARRIDLEYFQRPHPWRRARLLACILAVLLSLAFLGYYGVRAESGKLRLTERLYNPGPVSAAHALFENDCAKCHNANGRFTRAVSDAACLKCHDGAIHHPSQITLASADGKHAASCGSCHIEHRGHPTLSAMSDAHCTQCHADLPAATKGGRTLMQAHVTSFAPGSHPSFGRKLREPNAWVDPTAIKFNHQKHMPMQGVESNCTLCHSSTPSAVSPSGSALPTAVDRRYMRPVNYEANCMSCHPIKAGPTGPTLAHREMPIVRAQIANLPAMYMDMLAADPKRESKLTVTTPGPPPLRKPVTKKITEAQWLTRELEQLAKRIDRDADSVSGFEAVKKAIAAAATQSATTSAQAIDPNLVEFFIAFVAQDGRCNLCHEMRGDVPAVHAQNRLSPSATQPSPQLLATVPTGVGSLPRRWFAASRFDHDAHRDQTCVSCHNQAARSASTSDVLMPDMSQCVHCHRPTVGGVRAAPAGCRECHAFHDRSRERPPSVR